MKLRDPRDLGKPELMIIPMIDIMFFLLVFFMLSWVLETQRQIRVVIKIQRAKLSLKMSKSMSIQISRMRSIKSKMRWYLLSIFKAKIKGPTALGNCLVNNNKKVLMIAI